jgi:hypothetical protein
VNLPKIYLQAKRRGRNCCYSNELKSGSCMKESQMAHADGNISVLPNAGTFDEIRGASLNPFLFKPEAISAETLAANEKFRKATAEAPNWWDIGAPAVRAAAASGKRQAARVRFRGRKSHPGRLRYMSMARAASGSRCA